MDVFARITPCTSIPTIVERDLVQNRRGHAPCTQALQQLTSSKDININLDNNGDSSLWEFRVNLVEDTLPRAHANGTS